jgi:hypothetical protein
LVLRTLVYIFYAGINLEYAILIELAQDGSNGDFFFLSRVMNMSSSAKQKTSEQAAQL